MAVRPTSLTQSLSIANLTKKPIPITSARIPILLNIFSPTSFSRLRRPAREGVPVFAAGIELAATGGGGTAGADKTGGAGGGGGGITGLNVSGGAGFLTISSPGFRIFSFIVSTLQSFTQSGAGCWSESRRRRIESHRFSKFRTVSLIAKTFHRTNKGTTTEIITTINAIASIVARFMA